MRRLWTKAVISPKRALGLALLLSLVVHLGLLFGPQVDVPSLLDNRTPPLSAELRQPPKPLPPPVRRHHLPPPQPKAEPTPQPESAPPAPPVQAADNAPSPSAAPAGSTASANPTAEDSSPPAPGPDVLPEAAGDVNPRLPKSGSIRFLVSRGVQKFEVGQTTHRWKIQDGHYRLTGVTETTGLAAVFHPAKITYTSAGKVTAAGLQPEHFSVKRQGEESHEGAEFDWEKSQVAVQHGAPVPLLPGSQDFISFYYQFGYQPLAGGRDVMVATGKKYDRFHFQVVGTEDLDLPQGKISTVHLKMTGDSTMEIWLAQDYYLVPVKIRYIDRKGDLYDQIAFDINLPKEP